MPLTKRQREILNYLTLYSEQNGYAPSFEEIAENFSYNSLATVHKHLSNLERKGFIKRSYNERRAIEILPSDLLPKAIELTPGLESPTVAPLADPDWVAVRAMVARKESNQAMDELSALGAKAILASDIRSCRL